MSGGGLLQLVAFGAQDIYLTGNPEITFWNVAYRRHTNFAMDSMEQTFQGSVDFGRKVTCVVARNGDLVHKGYLQVTLPPLTANTGEEVAWTRNIGHVLIDEITVEIGGSVIDRVTGQYLTIRNELTQSAEKEDRYNVMIGNTVKLTTLASSIEDNTPLTSEPSLPSAALFLDYIFLEQDERRSFSQSQHEYLIEQLQFQGAESFTNSAVRSRLNLSHPVKELIWVLQLDSNVINGANRWSDFTDNSTGPNPYAGSDPLSDAKITLNTHDRITTRKASYFNIVQPYFHHTRIPATGIYVYSFALKPEEHQPSGTINMSRIEGTTLNMTLATGTAPVRCYVYGINYNILRITSGMGGLAYAN
ncbi:hypothetical protein HK102_005924 [Quaeritorhiza haematococci]|nr:hypothetical protein HK102_005924 [Quaeritorhiza haematococci]